MSYILRIHTQSHVVEMAICLAIACRAAHIRHEDSVSTRDEVLHQKVEGWHRLAFRSAMNDYHCRSGALGGLEEPRRNLSHVEGGVAYQFWRGKRMNS